MDEIYQWLRRLNELCTDMGYNGFVYSSCESLEDIPFLICRLTRDFSEYSNMDIIHEDDEFEAICVTLRYLGEKFDKMDEIEPLITAALL